MTACHRGKDHVTSHFLSFLIRRSMKPEIESDVVTGVL